MKIIQLTQNKVTLVDDNDYSYLNQWKWHAHVTQDECWYVKSTQVVKGTITLMHRLLIQPEKGYEVDHKNGDGLDNRRENLRVCLSFQNKGNTRKQANRSSQYKGVSYDISRDRWLASIHRNNKQFFLGRHSTEEAAAKAYDKAALGYFGEFALLNFPGEH